MELPKKITIGSTRYTVIQAKTVSRNRHGIFYPDLRIIKVALYDVKRKRTDAEVMETFWHEVTHAVLYDMKHPLWSDEPFVTAFSRTLNKMILTSEF